MSRSATPTVAWLGVLWLAAAALTVAAFYTLIPNVADYRGSTFYSVLLFFCVAELVFFAYLGYVLLVPHTVTRPSHAVRLRIMWLASVWLVAVLVAGSIAVHPSNVGTFYSDKVVLFLSILTFLVLVGAYFLHRQDVEIQVRQDAPQRERVKLQSYSGGVEAMRAVLKALGDRRPADATEIDRLAKRLDTLKTQLLAVSPQAERDLDRLVTPASPEEIEDRLRDLRAQVDRLGQAGPEDIRADLAAAREAADGAIAALRHRESTLSF